MGSMPIAHGRVRTLASLARRVLRTPPRTTARRLVAEANVELERIRAPRRGRRFDRAALLQATGAATTDELWDTVLTRPYPFTRTPSELAEIEERWPEERERVLAAAERATDRAVDVLGTGPVELGRPADWHRDWKTGRRWPVRYGRRMEYAELGMPTDVKVPWEISRLQWLLPAGQAYLLTGDDRYATGVREVLDDWMRGNPFARGVNWAIAMEPALRLFSWSWLLHACGRSPAWADPGFRSRFLRTLYLHGEFVDRHIERSEINGNHYTADAAGLVVAGLVLPGETPSTWARKGWTILADELPRQVHPDGVDFEASSAYHRLVGELFALPALLRQAQGLDVPTSYAERLLAMGRFTRAYTGPDGLAPLWGDADDGRALPLGGQDVNDHGSLPALMARVSGQPEDGNAEAAWLIGPNALVEPPADRPRSIDFPDGGVYILKRGGDHVFVDCGPVGLAGRGGHGHNDCLSFEATLDGTKLISDSGSYLYTASVEWRNRFRSTSFHSTPEVDGEEQNRFDPQLLWTLTEDARPEVLEWSAPDGRFRGTHSGYQRLPSPVRPIRTIELDSARHALLVVDTFDGDGTHRVSIPLQLAPDVEAVIIDPGLVEIRAGSRRFALSWGDYRSWALTRETGWVSRSYGVRVATTRLVWRRAGDLRPLRVEIAPEAS